MREFFKNMLFSAAVWIVKREYGEALKAVRFEAARKIIEGAENLRLAFRSLSFTFIILGFVGAGAAILLSGLSMMAVMLIVHASNPEASREFCAPYFWIPAGLCLGGLLSVVPAAMWVFLHLLSEEHWLNLLKRNRLVGKFVTEVLEEARREVKEDEQSRS